MLYEHHKNIGKIINNSLYFTVLLAIFSSQNMMSQNPMYVHATEIQKISYANSAILPTETPVPDVQRGAPVPVEQLIFPVMQNTNYRTTVVLPVARANTVPRGRINVRPVRTSPQIHRIPGIRTQTIVRGLATVGTI